MLHAVEIIKQPVSRDVVALSHWSVSLLSIPPTLARSRTASTDYYLASLEAAISQGIISNSFRFQELEIERQSKKKLEKEVKKVQDTLEEERQRQKQIVLLLLAERKKLILKYVEERNRSEDVSIFGSIERKKLLMKLFEGTSLRIFLEFFQMLTFGIDTSIHFPWILLIFITDSFCILLRFKDLCLNYESSST